MPTFTVTSNIDTAATDTSTGGAVTVGSTNYANAGNLRQAINYANVNPSTTITFARAGIGTKFLQADLPLVVQNTTITGQTGVVIDGRPAGAVGAVGTATYRGFLISGIASDGQNAAATTVGISNMTIQNVLAKGGAGADGGGGLGAGGAMVVGPAASVTLTNVDFSNAMAQGGTGAATTNLGRSGGSLAGDGGNDTAGSIGGGGGGILFAGGHSTGSNRGLIRRRWRRHHDGKRELEHTGRRQWGGRI